MNLLRRTGYQASSLSDLLDKMKIGLIRRLGFERSDWIEQSRFSRRLDDARLPQWGYQITVS